MSIMSRPFLTVKCEHFFWVECHLLWGAKWELIRNKLNFSVTLLGPSAKAKAIKRSELMSKGLRGVPRARCAEVLGPNGYVYQEILHR